MKRLIITVIYIAVGFFAFIPGTIMLFGLFEPPKIYEKLISLVFVWLYFYSYILLMYSRKKNIRKIIWVTGILLVMFSMFVLFVPYKHSPPDFWM